VLFCKRNTWGTEEIGVKISHSSNFAYHNFEDTKTTTFLINLNKIQKLYNIVKSNNFYFS